MKSVQSSLPIILLIMLFLGFSCSEEQRAKRQERKKSVHANYDDLQEIKQRGILRAIVDYNSINYFVYRGMPMGFQYEMLTTLADELGVSLQVIVSQDMQASFDMLNEGKADLIAQNITITSDRKKFLQFSSPYISTRQMLVQRKLSAENSSFVLSQKDLNDRKVWVQKETSFYQQLNKIEKEFNINIDIKSDSILGVEQLIEKVATKEINYTVCDEMIGEVNAIQYKNIDVSTPLSYPQQIAWALPKKSSSFASFVDAWIQQYKETAAFTFLYEKYYNQERYTTRTKDKYFTLKGDEISPYDDLIKKNSEKIGWDWRLVTALVYQESNFKPKARSWSGAMGLMQLMPPTAREMGVRSPYNPADNIKGGTKYLGWLDKYFSEIIVDPEERINFVLASYNAGLGHVLDARRLAKKYGKNENLWKDNVDYYIKNKSVPKYYRDEVVKWGYCRGLEPYNYVIQITERYEHYKNATENQNEEKT